MQPRSLDIHFLESGFYPDKSILYEDFAGLAATAKPAHIPSGAFMGPVRYEQFLHLQPKHAACLDRYIAAAKLIRNRW
jgi:hypothetical protein